MRQKYIKIGVVSSLLSIAIYVVLGIIFSGSLTFDINTTWVPHVNVFNNALSFIFLFCAVKGIKQDKVDQHVLCIRLSLVFTLLFLLLYVVYHTSNDPILFDSSMSGMKYIYYSILVSHIILSAVIVPLVLVTYGLGVEKLFKKHKKIAKTTFYLWSYVSLSGIAIYLMLIDKY